MKPSENFIVPQYLAITIYALYNIMLTGITFLHKSKDLTEEHM